MDEQEELELWARYRATREPESLERLVTHYTPLAGYLTRRAVAKAPSHQDPEDLLSHALEGLLDAVTRFEPERGLKFATFASRRIAGEIADSQRRADPLTRLTRKKVNGLRDAQRDLWDELGRRPEVHELAARLGESEGVVRQLMLSQQTLVKELSPDLSDDLHAEDARALEQLEDESRDALAGRLARLGERARLFVLLYYVERRTLREIGKLLECSDSRCAQIRKEVIATLTLP